MLINDVFSDFTQAGTNTNTVDMNFGGGLMALTETNSSGKATIDKFRVQVSIGSKVEAIKDTSGDGFTILYSEGDICNRETGQTFSSQVRYICDPSQSDSYEPRAPHLVDFVDCQYIFVWQSKYACTQCRSDQAQNIKGKCEASSNVQNKGVSTSAREDGWSYNGIRSIFNSPVAGERCTIFAREEVKVDGTPVQHFVADAQGNKRVGYVDKDTVTEECSIYEDLVENSPFVKFISMLVAVFVALFAICGCLICCSYFQLETKFNELQMTVQQQQQETGLPEDYNFQEDNVYMQEQVMRSGQTDVVRRRKNTQVSTEEDDEEEEESENI